ncbi:lysophospholipid acyltransferase family protein [Guyparkeria sp.]|uniref:lysophospholipid acyltransferase family protein n=1 Tax=Guyparkeria sp. TaxID=2035736 RepID=UPI003970FEC5
MRGFFRALARALRLVAYLVRGLWQARRRARATMSETDRLEFVRSWLAGAAGAIGVRVTVHGLDRLEGRMSQGALWLPNHVSWLDILVIGGLMPGTVFLAKSEIASWPLIGRLASLGGTEFIERGQGSAAAAEAVAEGLAKAGKMVVFAEGTTSDGMSVRRFHARLLGPAIEAGLPVVPVALRYFDSDGRRTTGPAFIDREPVWPSLWWVLTSRQTEVVVDILPPIDPDPGEQRSELARRAHHAVSTIVARSA